MIRVLVRRVLLAVPILFAVLLVTFLLLRLGGGDPSAAILGVSGTEQQRQAIRDELGLDKPVIEQFGSYLGSLVTGNLGDSLVKKQPVAELVFDRLSATLSVTLGALLVALVIGIALGVIAATRRGWVDRVIQSLSVLGFALPGFWLALVLIVVFASKLRLVPTSGYIDFGRDPAEWFTHLILPVAALSTTAIAAIALQTRGAMLDTLGKDYIRTLRAAGLGSPSVLLRHTLRGAAPTIIGVAGLQFIGLLGAVIFIEQVFGISGIGRLAVESAVNSDFTVLQGLVLFLALLVIIANLLVDLAILIASPKVRTS